jgi:nitrite reductase/ring-hydroxylating ferredoxin subunit
MQDIMEGKVVKVFMNIPSSNLSVWALRWVSVLLIGLQSCSPDLSDDQIPFQPFPDIVLNLNLPDNIALKTKGSSKAISGGVRGIIVYCRDVGVYYAYERNCSFHPNDACATVNIDPSTLFMIDQCCGSQFDFSTGIPTGGAAWRPLQKYKTVFDGADLIITDEVVLD